MTATISRTTTPTIDFVDPIDAKVDDEFAVGAARYLRNAGLSTEDIAASLTNELGLDEIDAARYAKAA